MLKQEVKDIRLAIMPLLQAEEDARYVKQVSRRVIQEFARFTEMLELVLNILDTIALPIASFDLCSGKNELHGKRI
jgi:hypothetical protein